VGLKGGKKMNKNNYKERLVINAKRIKEYLKENFGKEIVDEPDTWWWINAMVLEFLRRLIITSPRKPIDDKVAFKEFKRIYPNYTLPSKINNKKITYPFQFQPKPFLKNT